MNKNIFCSPFLKQIMKPFNIFIGLSLLVIFSGFVFLSKSSEVQELRMDTPSYLDYSDAVLINAQKKGRSILFFAATRWCQTCSLLEKEIIERNSEIPPNVTILKVDYDNDKTMNQRYGVTSQHTLVVLDENGKEVKRWLGGDFNALLQQFESI